jgi:hypothetical protein
MGKEFGDSDLRRIGECSSSQIKIHQHVVFVFAALMLFRCDRTNGPHVARCRLPPLRAERSS